MRVLTIILIFWDFVGCFFYKQFGSVDLMLSINMLIVSLFSIQYFDNRWVSLLLFISISNFLNHVLPFFKLSANTNLLSTLTTILILILAYSPLRLRKWKL